MKAPHVCKFDSKLGYRPGDSSLALMCGCGNWGMRAYGVWQVVPFELLPAECEMKTRLRSIRNVLLNCIYALSLGLLMALLVCPEAFR